MLPQYHQQAKSTNTPVGEVWGLRGRSRPQIQQHNASIGVSATLSLVKALPQYRGRKYSIPPLVQLAVQNHLKADQIHLNPTQPLQRGKQSTNEY